VNALCRYQLADSARSQRWVPSLLVYLIVLWLVYPLDAGPAVPAYGVTAGRVVPDPGMADSHDAEHPGPGRPADHRGHRPWSTAGPSGVVGLRGRRDPAVHRPGHRLGRVANHHNIHGWHAWLGGVVFIWSSGYSAWGWARSLRHRSCTARARRCSASWRSPYSVSSSVFRPLPGRWTSSPATRDRDSPPQSLRRSPCCAVSPPSPSSPPSPPPAVAEQRPTHLAGDVVGHRGEYLVGALLGKEMPGRDRSSRHAREVAAPDLQRATMSRRQLPCRPRAPEPGRPTCGPDRRGRARGRRAPRTSSPYTMRRRLPGVGPHGRTRRARGSRRHPAHRWGRRASGAGSRPDRGC